MTNVDIVLGCNYGDEGKGTVVANYVKKRDNVLNVLTNGGSQRGHSILTNDGSMTFQHFGAGTYHGADNYYSRFFILNPIQFVKEYESLIVKPKHIYRDSRCRWSTPYDSMANLIAKKSYNTCGMGIWNTIKRYQETQLNMSFDDFIVMDRPDKLTYLYKIKFYYEKTISIPKEWEDIWNSKVLNLLFINDCYSMNFHTIVCDSLGDLNYNNMVFENGQGLLLCDTGKDTPDTTPSNTGILYSLELIKDMKDVNVTAHYVTRPYLTRHGDGEMEDQTKRNYISIDVKEDRTNHFNECQGEFRYGKLNISSLEDRVKKDASGIRFELEVTHCDEIDIVNDFKKHFSIVNVYDSPLV